MNIKEYIVVIVLFIFSALLQLFFVPMITIYGAYPDFLIYPIVFFTIRKGQIYGTTLGFVYGLFFDLISGGVLGSAMFSYTLSGFVAGYFYDENRKPSELSSYSHLFIILLASAISTFFYSALGTSNLNSIFNSLLLFAAFSGIYSATISVPVILLKPFKILES